MRTAGCILGATVAIELACGGAVAPGPAPAGVDRQPLVSHTFDLASNMPAHLAVMYSMSWFGIPATDPQGAGPDPSYGNGEWNGACVPADDPAQCASCIQLGTGDACVLDGGAQRDSASRRRMLAGIYSASAQDTEGKRRVDLMLSNLRRPCDDGAKLDAWSAQLNGTRDTSLHSGNPACSTCEIAYAATLGFMSEADRAGLTSLVMPGDDATWYFHFGTAVGLGACDDTANNPKQNCIDALTQDATDMAQLAAAHPSAYRVAGKPVLFFYVDPGYLTSAQWATLLQNARNAAGADFYTVATLQNPTVTNYFDAFDGLAPWVQLDWTNFSGATVRAHAQAWTAGEHDPIFNAVAGYAGRVAFGGAAPGFDDYTEDWGLCMERELPPGDARDPALLLGEFDYFSAHAARGLILETWDDWTEGTEFEPDVAGGPAVLVSLRDQLGALYGEPADPAGDTRLANRWTTYGQARNCEGGDAGVPPVTDLTCADAGTSSDAGAVSDAGAAVDAGPGLDAGVRPDAGESAGGNVGSGCHCGASGGLLPCLGLLFWVARRGPGRRPHRRPSVRTALQPWARYPSAGR